MLLVRIPTPHNQRGAVLVVSLLLLLVMSLLALGGSQMTRMQERMIGSARNHDVAFQAAEAGLRAGERLVDAFAEKPATCGVGCGVYLLGELTTDLNLTYEDQAYQDEAWWNARATDYAAGAAISGEGLAGDEPQYYVEELDEVFDELGRVGGEIPPSRVYYRITSRAEGGNDRAQVVLQSTFARRFN